MHNVILIGMPGVGKSTLGVLLAKTLGMTFLDTDLVIQDQKKALLRELIAQHGIDGFLALEGTVCAGLQAENAVIATGGSGMVKAAYSSGTPAYGVGPGNPPVVLDRGYDLKEAAKMTVTVYCL